MNMTTSTSSPATDNQAGEIKELNFRVYGFFSLPEDKLKELRCQLTNHFYRAPEINGSIVLHAEIAGDLTPHIARLEALIGQLRRDISPRLRFAYEVVYE